MCLSHNSVLIPCCETEWGGDESRVKADFVGMGKCQVQPEEKSVMGEVRRNKDEESLAL